MKDKIEAKIDEILEMIISKDAKYITYNEYLILDNRLAKIKWDEQQHEKNKDMAELMVKAFSGYSCMPSELSKEDVK